MNTEKETEIIEMFDSGMKIPAIAEEMQLSATAIRNILKKHDRSTITVRPIRDEESIVGKYVEGVAIPTILAEYDLTYPVLYNILARHKIEPRRVTNKNSRQQRFDTAVAMYQEGYMLWQIQNETGIAQPTLHAELHKRGVPLRRNFTRAGTESIPLDSD